jgi:hypothetical protein
MLFNNRMRGAQFLAHARLDFLFIGPTTTTTVSILLVASRAEVESKRNE